MPTSPQIDTTKLAKPTLLALTHIDSSFAEIFKAVGKFKKVHPDGKEALTHLLQKFYIGLSKHRPHLFPPSPDKMPPSLAAEIKSMKQAATSLQETLETLQSQLAHTPLDNAPHQPPSSLPAPTQTPTSNLMEKHSLHNTNLKTSSHSIVMVHVINNNLTNCLPAHIICNSINTTLQQAKLHHVHISVAKWTMKGNIILTVGHKNTVQ